MGICRLEHHKKGCQPYVIGIQFRILKVSEADMYYLTIIIEWTNSNSGFLSLLLFFTTIFLGWVSGFFSSLMRKPKLKIQVLPGPTFCASFDTGRVFNGHKTHRTALSAYIAITNQGSAPTDIQSIHVGYKSQAHINPFRWFWLKEITVSKSDFVMEMGEDLKVFPFLFQKNQLTVNDIDTYLLEGKRCNGIIYFEQDESWGNYLPRIKANKMDIIIRITDSFGSSHFSKARINKVTLAAAKKVCENFGGTRESLKDTATHTNQQLKST